MQTLTAPERWPLGSAPPETLLEVDLCELEARRARGEGCAGDWAEHAGRWGRLGRPYRDAYAHLREAAAAVARRFAAGPRRRGLSSARATAARLGARPLLEQIELVSRRARIRTADESGEAARRGRPPNRAPTQRAILIAQGRTNPEIGQALYMSPKTASVHVSRILSKLDVKTRTEAAGLAHRLGLLDPR